MKNNIEERLTHLEERVRHLEKFRKGTDTDWVKINVPGVKKFLMKKTQKRNEKGGRIAIPTY